MDGKSCGCSARLPSNAKFCPECGTSVAGAPDWLCNDESAMVPQASEEVASAVISALRSIGSVDHSIGDADSLGPGGDPTSSPGRSRLENDRSRHEKVAKLERTAPTDAAEEDAVWDSRRGSAPRSTEWLSERLSYGGGEPTPPEVNHLAADHLEVVVGDDLCPSDVGASDDDLVAATSNGQAGGASGAPASRIPLYSEEMAVGGLASGARSLARPVDLQKLASALSSLSGLRGESSEAQKEAGITLQRSILPRRSRRGFAGALDRSRATLRSRLLWRLAIRGVMARNARVRLSCRDVQYKVAQGSIGELKALLDAERATSQAQLARERSLKEAAVREADATQQEIYRLNARLASAGHASDSAGLPEDARHARADAELSRLLALNKVLQDQVEEAASDREEVEHLREYVCYLGNDLKSLGQERPLFETASWWSLFGLGCCAARPDPRGHARRSDDGPLELLQPQRPPFVLERPPISPGSSRDPVACALVGDGLPP